jgi:hypothetical protein
MVEWLNTWQNNWLASQLASDALLNVQQRRLLFWSERISAHRRQRLKYRIVLCLAVLDRV